MEGHASFTSLVIVVMVALITPILLNRLRLHIIPVVVAEILAGLIIGQSGFDLVQPDMWLETLSTLGFVYLLFLSGLEIDFSVFARKKKKKTLPNGKTEPNGVVVALTVFLMILVTSYLLSLLFVWSGFIDNVYLMTLVIATISLGIVVPTLKDADIVKTSIGQTILLITVVGDLLTMVLLAVFVSIFSADGGNTWLLLILFGAGLVLYFVGKLFRHQSFLETMSKGTIQLDTRAVFALIILLVGLSEKLGTEIILGSFLAGALVSLLSPNPAMVQKLDSFGYGFLIPIFFVMIGVNLNIWELFTDREVILLMPLLFVAFVLAKLIPALWLKRWYHWKTVFSVGFLISAKLTLVIAAAKVGERMGLIGQTMSSAIILVAVISCILGPILFKKMFPEQKKNVQTKVVFIGANQATLLASLELDGNSFDTTVYHTKQENIDHHAADHHPSFHVEELPEYSIQSLKDVDAFDADILLVTTNDGEVNSKIAVYAKEYGTERVVARMETLDFSEDLRCMGIDVFSDFLSTKTILKAMILSPDVVDMITNEENGLFEIEMHNPQYHGTRLSKFPHLGDTIIVRIFRGTDSIVAHGDTELKVGDRLIVTGSRIHIRKLKEVLS